MDLELKQLYDCEPRVLLCRLLIMAVLSISILDPLSFCFHYQVPVERDHVMPMEQLPINNNGGQGYGFILYQTELAKFPEEIVMEQVFDRAQVFIVKLLLLAAPV